MFRLSSVVLLLAARAALSCPDPSWVGTGDGDCYLPLPADLFLTSAEDAEVVCTDFEPTSTLPEIHNYQDQLTMDELANGNSVWLGLSRPANNTPWAWPYGNDTEYTRWARGQPDIELISGNCVFSADGLWYNADCFNATHNVVCFTKVWEEQNSGWWFW